MLDYYSLLARKIKETETDPAKIRQVIYEAARLALRRQLNLYAPDAEISVTKRLLDDLEKAISRCEADAAKSGIRRSFVDYMEAQPFSVNPATSEEPRARPVDQDDDARSAAEIRRTNRTLPRDLDQEAHSAAEIHRNNRFPTRDLDKDEAPPAAEIRRNSRYPTRDPDEDEAPRLAAVERPGPGEQLRSKYRERFAERSGERSRELVLVPEPMIGARRQSTYLVEPEVYPSTRPQPLYDAPVAPPSAIRRRLLSGLGSLAQLMIASVAGVAIYVAVWGRPMLVAPVPPTPAVVQTSAGTAPPEPPAPAAPNRTSADGTRPATEALAPATPFPYPTAYGIYAISDNRLIELEQIATAPVDPRTRTILQIVKPSRTIIADAGISFIAYRRDLISSAPEKVPVRIAARIARSMNFDASGKAAVTTPANETWLVRDQGYDLRVSPVRESPEMIMLRPENPEFAFPAGRYELLLGGQAYDFVIAGAVTDPAQCVEGVATVRGPAFYECKSQ